jgi:hypothetical protein
MSDIDLIVEVIKQAGSIGVAVAALVVVLKLIEYMKLKKINGNNGNNGNGNGYKNMYFGLDKIIQHSEHKDMLTALNSIDSKLSSFLQQQDSILSGFKMRDEIFQRYLDKCFDDLNSNIKRIK